MIALDEARFQLARTVHSLRPVKVDLEDALGRCLARPVRSDVDLPPADVSAMDGYAVRHSDFLTGSVLPVAAEVAAGEVGAPLSIGAAARIFTGAPLPEGANTIVPQEQAHLDDEGNVSLEALRAGSHVRRRGEVIEAGTEVICAGGWITPQMVSVMAACGAARIEVIPAPRIATVVTGAEIVDVARRPAAGQIRDSNGPLLAALARASRLDVSTSMRAIDTRDDLRRAISESLASSDLVLTTGGVSIGDYDLVPEIVSELGGELIFHKVRMKPGKPLLAARFGSKLLIGLPGNPLAVLAGWRLFAWPAAAAMAGDDRAFVEAPVEARLVHQAKAPRSRTELRPAHLRRRPGESSVELVSWHGSHDVSAASEANALARFEPEGEYPEGVAVACFPLATGDPRPGEPQAATS